MAIALPIGVNERIVGTGFIAGSRESESGNNVLAIVTALHLLGNGANFQVGIPPHGGDVSRIQSYTLPGIVAYKAQLIIAEPALDMAVLLISEPGLQSPIPKFITSPHQIDIGEEVLVVGYPFAILQSFLETVEPCFVSALGSRVVGGLNRYEFIISHQTYPGSSGSPVIRKSDGVVCGVLRGCLAPPSVISIGNIPIGGDTNVTYVASAHTVPELVNRAFAIMKYF